MGAAAGAARAGMGRWNAVMSGGTNAECRERGEVTAAGTAKSKGGAGFFRAVLEGPVSRGGGPWEGRVTRVGGHDCVLLFLSIGNPGADTGPASRTVLSQNCWGGASSYIRGVLRPDLRFKLEPGETIWWRYNPAAGTVDARVEGRCRVVRLFDGAVGDEVYFGFFLDYDAEIQLIDWRCVADAAPAPAPAPATV